jgi:hypothetical protein
MQQANEQLDFEIDTPSDRELIESMKAEHTKVHSDYLAQRHTINTRKKDKAVNKRRKATKASKKAKARARS